MSSEIGAFLVGSNLALGALATTGRVLCQSPIQEVVVKSFQGFTSSEYHTYSGVVASTSATPVTILSVPCAVGEIVGVRVFAVSRQDSDASGGVYTMLAGARRAAAGNVTSLGTAVLQTLEDNAGAPVLSVNANTTTQALEVQFTGVAATNFYVEGYVEVLRHSLTA